jgi:hypothetical protein
MRHGCVKQLTNTQDSLGKLGCVTRLEQICSASEAQWVLASCNATLMRVEDPVQ